VGEYSFNGEQKTSPCLEEVGVAHYRDHLSRFGSQEEEIWTRNTDLACMISAKLEEEEGHLSTRSSPQLRSHSFRERVIEAAQDLGDPSFPREFRSHKTGTRFVSSFEHPGQSSSQKRSTVSSSEASLSPCDSSSSSASTVVGASLCLFGSYRISSAVTF
jgi:hypothetical protein